MCSQIVTNATGANNNKISGNCEILNALKSFKNKKFFGTVFKEAFGFSKISYSSKSLKRKNYGFCSVYIKIN